MKHSLFREVILKHFKLKRDIIKSTCEKWVAEHSITPSIMSLLMTELKQI
jgi:hypothetical protein